MAKQNHNVLILCTGNSARSILGEVLVSHLGGGLFRGFSAGSTPAGKVNPYALKLLKRKGHVRDGLRSKSWDEFSRPDAAKIDFVFTVCDNAAGESCPLWRGSPLQAHWGIPDPAAAKGTDEEIMAAFETAYSQLEQRISAFTALPLGRLQGDELQHRLEAIGKG